MKVSGLWSNISQILKEEKKKKEQPRILYRVKISSKSFQTNKPERIHHQQTCTTKKKKYHPLDRRKMLPERNMDLHKE